MVVVVDVDLLAREELLTGELLGRTPLAGRRPPALLTQKTPEPLKKLVAAQYDAVHRVFGGALALQERPQAVQGVPLLRQLYLDRDPGGTVFTLDPVRWVAGRDGGCPSQGTVGTKGESHTDPHEKRFYHHARKGRPT